MRAGLCRDPQSKRLHGAGQRRTDRRGVDQCEAARHDLNAASRSTRRTRRRSGAAIASRSARSRSAARVVAAVFASLTSLDVSVPSRSSVARTVHVDLDRSARVGAGRRRRDHRARRRAVAGGQSADIVLNPDPTNPDVENPDVENPDVENPDVENPDVENVEVFNPDVENPAVLGLANPDVENPDVENPDVENTLVLNPAIVTPDVENPDVENPDVENPDVENPDVENLDLINGGLSDTTWTLTNRGNTAASYSLKMLLNRGFRVGFRSQLLVHRVYQHASGAGLRAQAADAEHPAGQPARSVLHQAGGDDGGSGARGPGRRGRGQRARARCGRPRHRQRHLRHSPG